MAVGVTTTTQLNSLFNTIYERALFVAREMNMATNLVTNYSARGWMGRNISIRPQITAQNVAENVDFASPTQFGKSTQATLTPGEVMAQVILTDRDIDTDPDSAESDAGQELGNAIATKIDVDILSAFGSFTKDKGSAGQACTIAKTAAAISYLREQLAPMPLYAVWHPYAWHDLWVLLGQPATQQALLGDVANEALRSFWVGDWMAVRHFVSANVPTSGTDATNGIFNPQSIAFDVRKAPTMETQRDASLRATELNMSAGYAYGVRRDAFGVKLTCDVTEPT